MTTDDYKMYEPVDHTADLAYVARGRSPEQLFEHAALGMMSFLIDPASVEAQEEDAIAVDGFDAEELLVGWLQEILYRLEVHRRIYRSFRVESASPPRLRAVAIGEALDPGRHVLWTDIKAATYHDLKIITEDSPGGLLYKVRIVLDI